MVDNTHLFLYWNTLVFLTATPVTYIQGATDADRSERAEHLGVKQNLTFISFDIPELDRCLVLKLVLTNITAIYHYYLACNTSQSAIHIRVFGRQFCLRTLPSNTSKSGVYKYYINSPQLSAVVFDVRFSNLGVVFMDMDGSPYSSASQMCTLTLTFLRASACGHHTLPRYPRVTNACIAQR